MTRPLVIYHGPPCADGFTSAWVASLKFPDAEFFPAQYMKTEAPDVTGREVYVLDYSWDKETLQKMMSQAKSMVVIDHHLSQQKFLENLPGAVFSLEQSGAGLSWKHFFPNQPAPEIVRYVEDYDLWKHSLPNSREINAAISSFEQTFESWNRLNSTPVNELVAEGRAILREQNRVVDIAVRHAREGVIGGKDCMIANSPIYPSEIGNKLAHKASVGVVWSQSRDGQFRYSLRSLEDGPDVSVICKSFGGGGHKHAGGFSSEKLLPIFKEEIKRAPKR